MAIPPPSAIDRILIHSVFKISGHIDELFYKLLQIRSSKFTSVLVIGTTKISKLLELYPSFSSAFFTNKLPIFSCTQVYQIHCAHLM